MVKDIRTVLAAWRGCKDSRLQDAPGNLWIGPRSWQEVSRTAALTISFRLLPYYAGSGLVLLRPMIVRYWMGEMKRISRHGG